MGLGTLLIFVDQTYWRSGSTITTNRAFLLFAQALRSAFDRLLFLGRLHPDGDVKPYRCVPEPGCEFLPLPYYPSLYALLAVLRSLPAGVLNAWRSVGKSDVVLLGIPHPWALLLWGISKLRGREAIFIVRQDLLGRVRLRSSRLKRALGVLAVRILEGVFIRLSRRTLTFTVGDAMYHRYSRAGAPVHSMLVSLILARQVGVKPRTFPAGSESRRLLWVGRLDPDKGVEVLLETLQSLSAVDASAPHLDLVGEGQIEAELRQRAWDLGLQHRVSFRGYVKFGPDLEALYDQAVAFVLPSNESEGFPQVVLEAMAAGLPLVSTAVAGIPYLLRDGVEALLVPPRDPQALANGIRRVLSDRPLYERLSSAGLEFARRHSLEAERDRMLDAIRRHMEADQKPA